MIVAVSQHPEWLSNSWLVAAGAGAECVVIDAGAPAEPLLDACEQHDLRVRHVLLTHHHPDHVVEAPRFRERFGASVSCHPSERELCAEADGSLEDGQRLGVGGLDIDVLHVPGHTVGQLNFLVGGRAIFTGDTLFAGSVGGTRGPGHGTFEQLRSSILDRILALDPSTRVHPGHAGETTVERELTTNPFVLAWRGEREPLDEPCRAFGEAARLLTWADDYDGGNKAWVRFEDGRHDVVPGSRVERS